MCGKCASLRARISNASRRSTYGASFEERNAGTREHSRLVSELDSLKHQHEREQREQERKDNQLRQQNAG